MFASPEFSFVTPAQVEELLCGFDNLLIEVGDLITEDADAIGACELGEKIRQRIQAAREAVDEKTELTKHKRSFSQ